MCLCTLFYQGILNSYIIFCVRLAPKAGEAVGHAETAPAAVPRTPGRAQAVVNRRSAGVSLASQLPGMSRDGKTHLQILCQPEQQHRARYQTEGSRGAVKDRSGNGFPVVKVIIDCNNQQTFPRHKIEILAVLLMCLQAASVWAYAHADTSVCL